MAKRAKASRKKTKSKASRRAKAKTRYPGMMGDGTEEQNLNQRGNPRARITKREVTAAFRKKRR